MLAVKLLSVAEAAATLGVAKLTLRVWIRQRRLPHVQLGRRILIVPQDLERFIASHRVEAKSYDDR